MTTKKIPISFNDIEQAKIKELASLLGINGVYGDIAKTIKYSIDLALSSIKNPHKVYTDLEASNLDIYFTSIKNFHKSQKLQDSIKNSQKELEKYNPKQD